MGHKRGETRTTRGAAGLHHQANNGGVQRVQLVHVVVVVVVVPGVAFGPVFGGRVSGGAIVEGPTAEQGQQPTHHAHAGFNVPARFNVDLV